MNFGRAGAVALGLALLAGIIAVALFTATPRTSELTPGPTAVPASASLAATASAVGVAPGPLAVYFARFALPPLRGSALGSVPARNSAEDRISARLTALWALSLAPPNSRNLFNRSGRSGSSGQLGLSVRIDGDLATVTFMLTGGWGVSTDEDSRQLYQQLVYTISEEPGIRRALIREQGAAVTMIGTLPVAQPATREDVAGYAVRPVDSLSGRGTAVPMTLSDVGVAIDTDVATRGYLRLTTPGVGRVAVALHASAAVPSGGLAPRFQADLQRCDPPDCDGGKWTLTVALPDVVWSSGNAPFAQTFDRSPFRSVRAAQFQGGTVAVAIRLDDALPWRIVTEPSADGANLYIDVGGFQSSVSSSVVVYSPTPGQGMGNASAGCTPCAFEGAARTVSGKLIWIVRDSAGHELTRGTAATTPSDDAAWRFFVALATIPPSAGGQPTVEIYTAEATNDAVRVPVTMH